MSAKVELVINDKNLGKSSTLARLINDAPSAIVGILDPDDALYPEATAAVLAAYRSAPQVGFVYTNFARYSADLQTILAPGEAAPIAPGRSALIDGYVGALHTFRVQAYRQTIRSLLRLLITGLIASIGNKSYNPRSKRISSGLCI